MIEYIGSVPVVSLPAMMMMMMSKVPSISDIVMPFSSPFPSTGDVKSRRSVSRLSRWCTFSIVN